MDIRLSGNSAVTPAKAVQARVVNDDTSLARTIVVPGVKPEVGQKLIGSEPSLGEVRQAVEDINKSLQSLSQGLEFEIDTESKKMVVKVIDHQTKEVIRQMPTEDALRIAMVLDQVLGKLLSEKA